MLRTVLAAAAALALAPAAPAQADKPVTLRWYGQSFFQVVTPAGTSVVFDPHQLMEYPRVSVPADLVLVSHAHPDHAQLDAIENKARAKVMLGVNPRGRGEWNLVDEAFRDVRVRSVGVYHDAVGGMQRGKNAVFVVEVAGLRFAHLGDLGHELTPEQVRKVGPVDVLMVPVGGVFTLNGADARRVVEQLKPARAVLPMHYGTKVFHEVLPVDEFIDELTNVERRTQTNELTFDPKAAAPKVAPVVLLGYEK